jgi:hypothetical protein
LAFIKLIEFVADCRNPFKGILRLIFSGRHGSSSSKIGCQLKVFQARSARRRLRLKEEKEKTMRSDLIFGALTHVNNRYELCQLASKATRKLHKPNTRLQDTTNEVLDRFRDTIPMDESEAVVQKVQLQERRAA